MKYILSIMMVMMFSGCAGMYDAGNTYLKEKKLDNLSTVLCYDYLDKKDCPSGFLQADIDVFSYIPSYSRFCFGFSEHNSTLPIGMSCVRKNIIKD